MVDSSQPVFSSWIVLGSLWLCAVDSAVFQAPLGRKAVLQTRQLNRLDVIGWVQAKLTAVQSSFTPALVIFVL